MPGASVILLSQLAIQFVSAAITAISMAANIVDKVTIRKSKIFRKMRVSPTETRGRYTSRAIL